MLRRNRQEDDQEIGIDDDQEIGIDDDHDDDHEVVKDDDQDDGDKVVFLRSWHKALFQTQPMAALRATSMSAELPPTMASLRFLRLSLSNFDFIVDPLSFTFQLWHHCGSFNFNF